MEAESRPIIQACSINGLTCRNGKRDDFPVDPMTGEKFHCHKWVKIEGRDPQTGREISTWCCNEFAKIKLLLENAKMSLEAGASSDKVATEVAKFHATSIALLPDEDRVRLAASNPQLMPRVEQKNLTHERLPNADDANRLENKNGG